MKNDQLIKLAQGLIGKKVSIARNGDILAKGEIEGLYGIPEGLKCHGEECKIGNIAICNIKPLDDHLNSLLSPISGMPEQLSMKSIFKKLIQSLFYYLKGLCTLLHVYKG